MLDAPELPEVPQFLVWGRWLLHRVIGDPSVIKKGWQTILILVVLICTGVWYLDKLRYEDRITNLEAADKAAQGTIHFLQTMNGQLQDQLKGTSPQLAAIQAGRDSIRTHPQTVYVRSAEIATRVIVSQDNLDRLIDDANVWSSDTYGWIRQNMGDAAAERFNDQGKVSTIHWNRSFNSLHNDVINNIAQRRDNVSIMIETAAWDGKPMKK